MIKKLAKIKEEQGLIVDAANLMQEIVVCVDVLCYDIYQSVNFLM